jgi:hypothetical protein
LHARTREGPRPARYSLRRRRRNERGSALLSGPSATSLYGKGQAVQCTGQPGRKGRYKGLWPRLGASTLASRVWRAGWNVGGGPTATQKRVGRARQHRDARQDHGGVPEPDHNERARNGAQRERRRDGPEQPDLERRGPLRRSSPEGELDSNHLRQRAAPPAKPAGRLDPEVGNSASWTRG